MANTTSARPFPQAVQPAAPSNAGRPVPSPFPKPEPFETAWVEIPTLLVDESYQHRPYAWAIERLRTHFNEALCGLICVNVRPGEPGVYYVIDGQTRKRVYELQHRHWIRAEIHRGLTLKQEAEFYLVRAINTQRQPTDMFAAECTARRPDAVLLAQLLRKHNLAWQPYATPGATGHPRVTCIRTLKRLLTINPDGKCLDGALALLLDTWPANPKALTQTVIGAMFYLMRDHGAGMQRKRFVERLGAYKIEDIHSTAQQLRRATTPQPTLYMAFLRKLLELYQVPAPAGRRL